MTNEIPVEAKENFSDGFDREIQEIDGQKIIASIDGDIRYIDDKIEDVSDITIRVPGWDNENNGVIVSTLGASDEEIELLIDKLEQKGYTVERTFENSKNLVIKGVSQRINN